jgi:FkbM family methyltransferase
MGKPKTFVQVGAYLGDDRLIEACRRDGHRLYMFEPNPSRAEELRRKVGDASNIQVIPAAVSNYNGRAVFHIAGYDDCSSLQSFDASANSAWVHPWHPYRKFEMVDELEVEVIRLDTFMERNGIDSIDRLEVDAQGEDLRVVESLGERVACVRKIQIEVNIHTSPLYGNSFTRNEAVAFFAERSFERHVSWKQSMNREENITFRNRRFYPNFMVNTVTAGVEQSWKTVQIAAVKLPRVLSVTRMIWQKKLTGRKV